MKKLTCKKCHKKVEQYVLLRGCVFCSNWCGTKWAKTNTSFTSSPREKFGV